MVLSCLWCQRIQLLIIELACSQLNVSDHPDQKEELLGTGEIHASTSDGQVEAADTISNCFSKESRAVGKGGIVHGCVDYNELCLLLAASCQHPSPSLGSDAAQGSL